MTAKLLVAGLALLGLVSLNHTAAAEQMNEMNATSTEAQTDEMPMMFINVETKQVVQVDANGVATPVDAQTIQALSAKWHAPDEEAADGSTKADNYIAQTLAFHGIGGGVHLGPIGGGFHLGRGGIGGGAHLGPIGGGARIGRGGIGGGFFGGGRWHHGRYHRHGRYYAGEWAPYTACASAVVAEFCF